MNYPVAISRDSDPYQATLKALELIQDGLVGLPKNIVLKPNVLSVNLNDCVVTNSRVCAAIADFLKEKGFHHIILAEGSTHGRGGIVDTIEGFKNHDYATFGSKWRMIDLNKDDVGEWFNVYSPGLNLKVELGIAKTVLSNSVISVPKFKTHDVLGLTLSLKNMMGSLCMARNAETGEIIVRGNKAKVYMHGFGINQPAHLPKEINIGPSKLALAANILRLITRVKPSLAVIDGTVAMEGDGPVRGSRKKLDLVLASVDPVAADVVAATIAGVNPYHTGYLYAAGLLGFGNHQLDKIRILGEKIEDVRKPFVMHRDFAKAKFTESEIIRLKKLTEQNSSQNRKP